MSRTFKYDRANNLESVFVLALSIWKIKPTQQFYRASNYMLEYTDCKETDTTTIKVFDKKDRPIGDVIFDRSRGAAAKVLLHWQHSGGGPVQDQDYEHMKKGLRQFLIAVPLQDFSYAKNPNRPPTPRPKPRE